MDQALPLSAARATIRATMSKNVYYEMPGLGPGKPTVVVVWDEETRTYVFVNRWRGGMRIRTEVAVNDDQVPGLIRWFEEQRRRRRPTGPPLAEGGGGDAGESTAPPTTDAATKSLARGTTRMAPLKEKRR